MAVSKTTIEAIFLNERLRDEVEHHLETKKELQRMATHDPLTGLPNRRLLNDLIDHIISISFRNKKRFAVMFIDLDNFKVINDTYGHDTGDKLLTKVAEILQAQTRESDIVARMGGDEFVVVYTEINEESSESKLLASRILSALSVPIELGEDVPANIVASIGIAIYPENGTDKESLIKAADNAMYSVKTKGKNQFSFVS